MVQAKARSPCAEVIRLILMDCQLCRQWMWVTDSRDLARRMTGRRNPTPSAQSHAHIVLEDTIGRALPDGWAMEKGRDSRRNKYRFIRKITPV